MSKKLSQTILLKTRPKFLRSTCRSHVQFLSLGPGLAPFLNSTWLRPVKTSERPKYLTFVWLFRPDAWNKLYFIIFTWNCILRPCSCKRGRSCRVAWRGASCSWPVRNSFHKPRTVGTLRSGYTLIFYLFLLRIKMIDLRSMHLEGHCTPLLLFNDSPLDK